MKGLLLATTMLFGAGAANAADMGLPTKAPPPMPAPVATWTGGYIGVDGGYASGNFDINTSTTLPSSTTFTAKNTGFLIGGFGGYNYQLGYFVIGAETDINVSTQKATSGSITANPGNRVGTVSVNVTEPWVATARGRIGYLMMPNLLIYGTGGGAYGDVQFVTGGTTANIPAVGWVVGGGVEGKIYDRLLARVEYRYTDLSGPSATNAAFNVNTHATSNAILGALGYKFN